MTIGLVFYDPKIKIVTTCACGTVHNNPKWEIRKATEDDVRAWAHEKGFALVSVTSAGQRVPQHACRCQTDGMGST